VEKVARNEGYLCNFSKQLAKVNNHLFCENSPNLVTLLIIRRLLFQAMAASNAAKSDTSHGSAQTLVVEAEAEAVGAEAEAVVEAKAASIAESLAISRATAPKGDPSNEDTFCSDQKLKTMYACRATILSFTQLLKRERDFC
jgi:hypothetical protein